MIKTIANQSCREAGKFRTMIGSQRLAPKKEDEMLESSAGKVFAWKELPTTQVLGGMMERAGFRGDNCLLTFNWIKPGMPRWKPHAHPFDQIVLTLSGTQILEIDGEAFKCPTGSIVRVPGNAVHTGWPEGKEPVLNIDVFPLRPDYLYLTKHQGEYAQPAEESGQIYHQVPNAEPFAGRWRTDTKGLVYKWDELPQIALSEGTMMRSAFRGDDSLTVFNFVAAKMPRAEPHSHPFDQLVLIVSGRLILEIDGKTMECGPGTITRVPANAKHTGWAVGREPVLNIDIFSPAREDYLHLTSYQKEFASAK
jgi:quercetin dioxygenase-like cupin family protein